MFEPRRWKCREGASELETRHCWAKAGEMPKLKLQSFKTNIFESILLSSGFQKCASGGSGEHIFVKIGKQNASELKFHQKAVLQIAFLMHIRIMFHRG